MWAFLLDIIGNGLIIFIVAATRKMRTPTNILLVNLAVADLLVALMCMWVHLGMSITTDWPFGLIICKVNMFAQGRCQGHILSCLELRYELED